MAYSNKPRIRLGPLLLKGLIILGLIAGIVGAAYYWTNELFLRPQLALKEEKRSPPEPPPPDPALPELEKAVALQKSGDLVAARAAFAEFVEHNATSTVINEAKDRLGEINSDFYFSTKPAPEKEIYVVKSGDVLNKVAARMKTTPELIMRSNNLAGTMLRIGQKLSISPAQFSLIISRRERKVTLLNGGKFFKHYPMRSVPEPPAATGKKPVVAPKITSKVNEKIAWSAAGQRVTFAEKEYAGATHWIVSSPGYTLYSDPEEGSGIKATTPPTGLGLSPEHMEELAALLSRGNPVTIEP